MNIFLNKKRKVNLQKGQALLISLVFFTSISLAVTTGLVVPTVKEFKLANTNLKSKQAFFLAESGVEDSYYRVKANKPIGTSETLTINGNIVATSITTVGDQKTISSEAEVSNYNRKNELVLIAGTGVSFSYGVQSGKGGIVLANNSQINGSVYSNGSVVGGGRVTGSVSSANAPALVSDQSNDTGTPLYNISFSNTNATEDFAQSFQVSSNNTINKIDLYLRKIGAPANLTVRIYNDNAGVPGTLEIASGAIAANLVSTNYGWVSVPLSTNPLLSSGITYWFVIDGATNSSKYYQIGANDNGYLNGIVKLGKTTWNNYSTSTVDSFFKIYLGGGALGLISGVSVGHGGTANAHANTVTGSTITGNNYCQNGTGNNKSCNTSLPDPAQTALPISDQNTIDWKNAAEAGGVYVGDIDVNDSKSFGPRKIIGNLSVNGSGDLTLNGAIWIQGNLTLNVNSDLRLASSYGTSDGIIIVDGTITINNNATVHGSGTTGSYILLMSTSSQYPAITLGHNAGAAVLHAQNGTVQVLNNSGVVSVNGYRIELANNAVITFETGLIDSNFVTGPSGGWSVSSWKEIE